MHHIDVYTVFIYSDNLDDIYMTQPPNYIKPGEEHLIYKV
jgi:hypothetical protein